jgi:thiamine-phosphate pyrophosphorylase
MLVTGDRLVRGRDLAALCQAAERGGVTSIQVRLQEATSRELAAAVRAVLAAVQVPVLVNGRADVAIACRAAGVHLGPEDVPAPLIRRIAPMGFIIGASVGTAAEVQNGRGADYWSVGPWNSSGSMPDAGLPLGPAGFAAIVRRAEGRPCIASGGIRPEDVPEVIRAGGGGVAVASGILGLAEVEPRARAYRQRNRHDEPG